MGDNHLLNWKTPPPNDPSNWCQPSSEMEDPSTQRATKVSGLLYLNVYFLRRSLTSTAARTMTPMSNMVATNPNPMANLLTLPEH